ncbi:MAG: hypothetical protein Kow00106_15370 [Anaerolineae bacterium]
MGARSWWFALAALALALACYYLPWYDHSTAAFTLHAYDLAEWTSLHPAVRAETPALWTSLLLRLPQITLVWAGALLANVGPGPRLRTLVRVTAFLVALRFVPPREFLGTAAADPNYRQMAALTTAGLAGILLAVLVQRLPGRWQFLVAAGLALVGVLAGWWGMTRVYPLLDNFQIEARIGAGAVGYTLFCLAGAGILALNAQQSGPSGGLNKKGG